MKQSFTNYKTWKVVLGCKNLQDVKKLPYEWQQIPDYKGFESKEPNLENQQFELNTSQEIF